MPILNVDLTVDDLLAVVAELNNEQWAEFEAGYEQLWFSRFGSLDSEVANIASKHRLSPPQQARLSILLNKNREEGLSEAETTELDNYVGQLDDALEQTAAELLTLSKHRQQTGTSITQ